MDPGVALDVGKHLVDPRYGHDLRLDRKKVVRIGFSQLQCGMHGRSMAQPELTPAAGWPAIQATSMILCPTPKSCRV